MLVKRVFGTGVFVAVACLSCFVEARQVNAELANNLVLTHGLHVLLALAVTLALIWGLSRFALKKRWHRSDKQQGIKVVHSLAIGARDRLMLVEVENQRVLIGSTPGQLQALHAYEPKAVESFQETLNKEITPHHGEVESSALSNAARAEKIASRVQ